MNPEHHKRDVSLTLDPDLLRRAKAAAYGQGTSLSQLVGRLLARHLERDKERQR